MPLTGAFQDLALKVHNQNIALWTTPGAMARDIRNRSVCSFLTLTCPNGTAISARSRILFAVTRSSARIFHCSHSSKNSIFVSDFETLKAPCVELRLALTLYPGWSPFHFLFIPSKTFSAATGSSVIRTPVALKTALATAAGTGVIACSAAGLALKGPGP